MSARPPARRAPAQSSGSRGKGPGRPDPARRDAVVALLGVDAHVADQFEHGGHVLQARNIAQGDRLGGQQAGAQLGQGGVFCTGDVYLAL